MGDGTLDVVSIYWRASLFLCVRRVTDFALGTRDDGKQRIGVRGYGGPNNPTNHASQDGFICQYVKQFWYFFFYICPAM